MLTIVSLILIGVNISLLSNKLLAPVYANNKVKKEYEEIIAKRNEEIKKITDKKTDVEMAETELKEVKKMKEKQRMQYYFSKYITYIEEKNYEKAYNLLYEEYRNNYFPTLEEFEKYVKQKYPDFMSVEYNDMSRQGEYYILTVNIYNLLTNEIIEKEQKYIIKENNFLDYVLSFQVRYEGDTCFINLELILEQK